MGDRLSAHHEKMMREPRYRQRAGKNRKKKLEQRVSGLVTNAMLFASLAPTAAAVLHAPHLFWASIAIGLIAMYNLSVFLLDSTVLTMDLRAADAKARVTPVDDAAQPG